jgi:hypothetical protein
LKRDFRILTEIGNLLYKEKNKQAFALLEANPAKGSGVTPSFTVVKPKEKDLNKNNLFPLSLFQRKGSFLNTKTYDYLNSVSCSATPTNFMGNLNEPKVSSSFTSAFAPRATATGVNPKVKTSLKVNDVIYQYLKTFSIFNKRKNGILLKYNQHIGYNFNSKNILLRGVEPKIISELVPNKSIPNSRSSFGVSPFAEAFGANADVIEGGEGYNRSSNNRLIKYSYKLLFYFFKSMYCLISKPVFLFTPDKVTIQLFYFLNIPKFKVFKWYSILNNKLILKKWYSLRFNKKLDNLSNIPSDTELSLSRTNKLNTIISPSKGKPYTFPKEGLPLSYYNKEMMKSVKLTWRIKKTLFRLNKKRNKVKHILFNLNKVNLFKVFSLKFKLICDILSNKFKKPVELQLIRIHQPFHDSNILVNLLSLNIRNKKFKTNVQIEKLYAKKAVKNLYDYSNNSVNFIPTFLSGIKIRIGGRLMREPIIPRITTKNFERGASSPGKVNFLDTATITKKNRKGSYTIKISSGQNFF